MARTPFLLVAFLLLASSLPAQEVGTTYLQVIFDSSGSMEKETERTYSRELKVRIACDEIRAFVSQLDRRPGLQVALRVFGMDRDKGCADSTLLRSFGPIDAELLAAIDTITPAPFGKTPIALSLTESLADFESVNGKNGHRSILLITDGIETCEGDVDAAISRIAGSEIGLKVHIVGFDVLDWEDPAQKKLQEMATATGGEVLYPKNREELERDLKTIADQEAPPPAVAETPAPTPTLMDRIRENVVILIVAIIVIVLGAAVLLLRRGSDNDE